MPVIKKWKYYKNLTVQFINSLINLAWKLAIVAAAIKYLGYWSI